MALQMLQVQICFVTMRALVFSLCVLGGICGGLACRGSGPTRMRRQYTAPSLLSNNMQRLRLLVCENRRMRV
jgi:hypothetical protein